MGKVLHGIRVLDFGRYAAAPVAAMMLADLGAEVIRIEKPGGEEDRTLPPFSPNGLGLLFMNCSRHKKSITLDLMKDESKRVLYRLVEKADVVIHNFPPGTRPWKILSYDRLQEIKPTIIVAAVSAFGQNGPYARRPGYESVAQAMCGAMSISGFPENPPTRAQVTWVDTLTAAHCALGVMFALYHRVKAGEGQMVDVSLLDSAVFAFAVRGLLTDYQMNGVVPYQIGNNSHYVTPGYLFKAKDGWVMLTAAVNPLWRRMVKEIGRPELADDPKFQDTLSRFENREILNQIIEEWTRKRTVDEILVAMERAHVPAGPVYNVEQVVNDPQVKEREVLVNINYSGGNALLSGIPIKLSRTPGKAEAPVPDVGEYNDDIYQNLLGLDCKEISSLKKRGVI